MNYAFAFILLVAAMAGGAWMIKISNENSYDAAISYAIIGLIWVFLCFATLVKVL